MLGTVSFIRRHQLWVMRLGGLMLVTVGVLLLTGVWDYLIAWTQSQVGGFETVV
jgi:cytochrome c-type biogenesis protein